MDIGVLGVNGQAVHLPAKQGKQRELENVTILLQAMEANGVVVVQEENIKQVMLQLTQVSNTTCMYIFM